MTFDPLILEAEKTQPNPTVKLLETADIP